MTIFIVPSLQSQCIPMTAVDRALAVTQSVMKRICTPTALIGEFLLGSSLRQLMANYHLTSPEIYSIIQHHFRASAGKTVSQEMSKELERLLRENREKNDTILTCCAKFDEARHCCAEMEARLASFEEKRRRMDDEHVATIANYEERFLDQDDHIQRLEAQLAAFGAPAKYSQDETEPNCAKQSGSQATSVQQAQIIRMFCQGNDLTEICQETASAPLDVFRIVQIKFTTFLKGYKIGIVFPSTSRVDREKLLDLVRRSSFLFSLAIFDHFHHCTTPNELTMLLTAAFDDFSQFEGRDWKQMATFVVEMIYRGVVYNETAVADLEETIADLKSLRGRLTRKFRAVKAEHSRDFALMRIEICRLRTKRTVEQEHGIPELHDTKRSQKTLARAEILNELIALSQAQGRKRYSPKLYYLALRVLFRAHSVYEYLRNFLTLPSRNSIYTHFDDRIKASIARLTELSHVESYLASEIARHTEIANGAVFAVDAISCANCFLRVRNFERSENGYLFVIFLQPLHPNLKCSPLLVLQSKSGIGDVRIQAEIERVLQIARAAISRVFVASDGDPSYNNRHAEFMKFWTKQYEKSGLDSVFTELIQYSGVFPLSDLLHLGKNFRNRLLKYELTFCSGRFSTSINHQRLRQILGYGPPLNDMTATGKMRDFYPLVIMRLENVIALMEQNAHAEAVALLPLSFCFNAIRLETITTQTRFDMLCISFMLVWELLKARTSAAHQCPEKSAPGAQTTLFTSQWTTRFLNTVLILLFALQNYDRLALDRLGTHPLENFFGSVRLGVHEINTADQMIRKIAQTDVVREADWALGLEESIRSRVNLAGVRVGDPAADAGITHVEMPVGLEAGTIAKLCLKAAHTAQGALSEDDQVRYLQVQEYLKALDCAACRSRLRSETSHYLIATSASRIVTLLKSHSPRASERGDNQ